MIYEFTNDKGERHVVELFDSIHNLPVLRFQRFNKYQMQSVEIGNTFEDYRQRTMKVVQFLQKDMKEEAIQELENRSLTVFNAFNTFTPSGKSFAVLVKRIDDVDYTTFSPDDLERCFKHLDRIGLTQKESIDKLKEVKKKIELELVVYFPKFFPKDGNDEINILRKQRIEARLESLTNPEGHHKDAVFEIEREMLGYDKPKIWNVHVAGNMERVLEIEFQKFALMVAESHPLESMVTITFYSKAELLKEKNTPK